MKVLWAVQSSNPWPSTRKRGSKAAGLRYERTVAKALPEAEHGTWFKYDAGAGIKYCSPDLIIPPGRQFPSGLVIEIKLKDCIEAWRQLKLYKAVLWRARGWDCTGIVICRHLAPFSSNIFTTLEEAYYSDVKQPIVHWLGTGELSNGKAPRKTTQGRNRELNSHA